MIFEFTYPDWLKHKFKEASCQRDAFYKKGTNCKVIFFLYKVTFQFAYALSFVEETCVFKNAARLDKPWRKEFLTLKRFGFLKMTSLLSKQSF